MTKVVPPGLPRLRRRARRSHKGEFGHVLVLAGAVRYTGAAYLCSQACLRTGSGLVTLGTPRSCYPILARKLTEVMTMPLAETSAHSLAMAAHARIAELLRHVNVVALGPGLSRNGQTGRLVRRLVKTVKLPMVIDADGLNHLAGQGSVVRQARGGRVLTPHPGEMARLCGVSRSVVERHRAKVAQRLARAWRCVIVLKGHRTVVCDAAGHSYTNTTGNPGLATGGTGDVLTGMIASLIGQGWPPFEAACTGVYLHGLSGDAAARARGEAGLIATDLLDRIPSVIRRLQR
ncbi:MAG: NAD(P)H-hydrate dehydratase [Candidatus Omnitrophica bacterium]|nr:NAD(P)H-hydrate dehydratase [Candidatus Omnitrophota bacterium]